MERMFFSTVDPPIRPPSPSLDRIHQQQKFTQISFPTQLVEPIYFHSRPEQADRRPNNYEVVDNVEQELYLSFEAINSDGEKESDNWQYGVLKNMYTIPDQDKRGVGVIFTIDRFSGCEKKRSGSSKDKENLIAMFTEMKLIVHLYENRKSKQIMEILEDLATNKEKLNNTHYVLFVAFSTHGDRNDTIYGSDKTGISLNTEIIPLFKAEKCPALKGKPKIFLIQACRGDREERVLKKTPTVSDASVREEVISNESDILIAYSCPPECKAWRTENDGSWFINDLCRNYSHFGKTYHFQEILNLTNQSVLRRSITSDTGHNFTQTLHVTSTLRMSVFIEPLTIEVGHVDQDSDSIRTPTVDSGPYALNFSREEGSNDHVMVDNIDGIKEKNDDLFVYDVKGLEYNGLGIILVTHKCRDIERKGSHKDLENYKDLFDGMKLKKIIIKKFNQQGLESITDILKEHHMLKCFFIAISTHGYMKDGFEKLELCDGICVKVDHIVDLLQDECITAKPKVLLIQACRGTLQDTMKCHQLVADTIPSKATQESDMLVAYSCAKGYESIRNQEEGSWFISELKIRHERMKGRFSFTQILTAVNNRIIETYKSDNSIGTVIKQTCEYRSTLRGELNI